MRKTVGPILLGVGGFLLTTALLMWIWVPGQVKKTPLDVNSLTTLSGEASYLGSPTKPVKATSKTVVDGKASTRDIAVFDTFTCLLWNPDGNAPNCVSADGPDSQLINASLERCGTDRKTALAVAPSKLPSAKLSSFDGLVNKFPFDAQKKTYKIWDGILARSVDVAYQAEEKIQGLDTYRFAYTVENEPTEIADGVAGTYSQQKTYWVHPATGSFVKQEQKELRKTEDGTTALDLHLTFDDKTVSKNVKDAKANGSKLSLLSGTLPILSLIAGLVALALGLFFSRRSADTAPPAEGTRSARRANA